MKAVTFRNVNSSAPCSSLTVGSLTCRMVASLVFRLIAKTEKNEAWKWVYPSSILVDWNHFETTTTMRMSRSADPNIACDQVDSFHVRTEEDILASSWLFFRSCSRCLLYSWVVHMKQLLYPKPTHSSFFLAPFFSWLKKTLGRQGTAMELHSTHSISFMPFSVSRLVCIRCHSPLSSFTQTVLVLSTSSSQIRKKKETIFCFLLGPPPVLPSSSDSFERGTSSRQAWQGRLMFAHDNWITKIKIGSNRKPIS